MGVMLGASASASAVAASHQVALVMTIVMLVLSAYTFAHNARDRRGYGPLVLCLFASPLLLANPIVNLLEDYEYIDNFGPMNTFLNVKRQQLSSINIVFDRRNSKGNSKGNSEVGAARCTSE